MRRKPRGTRRSVTLLAAAAVYLLSPAFLRTQSLPEKDPLVTGLISEISAVHIRTSVETLAGFGTRHSLSDTISATRGIGAARRWIKSEFERYARQSGGRMRVAFEETTVAPSGRVPRPLVIVNVVATLDPPPPFDSTRTLVVSGHYDSRASNPLDSLGDAPGADDDASGVAIVLELARVMSGSAVRIPVRFVAFAGEEQGLLGATSLAEQLKRRHCEAIGVFNNDIVGSSRGGSGERESHAVRLFSEATSPADTGDVLRRRVSLGLENDGVSRSLARYIALMGERYVPEFRIAMIYRRDRFLRGGDHAPFHERGFAAVRFTEAKEDFSHQHQDVRTSNDTTYGDLAKFMDFEYCANIARANAAGLASLAFAPPPPSRVSVLTQKLEYGSTFRWSRVSAPDVAGYRVWYRETSSSLWKGSFASSDTTLTISLSKDDFLFGVQTVGRSGSGSAIISPLPARE